MVSMLPVMPTTTPQDTHGAFAILAMLGDDNRFKKRLEELQKHAQAADAASKAAAADKVEANRKLAELDVAKKTIDASHEDLKGKISSLDQAKAQHESAVAKFVRELSSRRQALEDELSGKTAERERDLANRETTLKTAEVVHQADIEADNKKIIDSQTAVRDRELAADARQRDLDGREGRVQQAEAQIVARKAALAELEAALKKVL